MGTTHLYESQRRRGARFEDDGERSAVASFGDSRAEASAAHSGAIVADLATVGHFRLGGRDGVKFLQGLVTNDVGALTAGTGCYAAFLNVHGRIECDCHVFSFGDELVIQTPPERTEWVATKLGMFRLAGDFQFESLERTHAALTLQGPEALGVLERAVGSEIGPLARFECREIGSDAGAIRLLGVRRSTEWGVDILSPIDAIERLYDAIVASGATPAGAEALEILRLEAGIPRWGRDFDADTVLQEVDVPEIVSFHKGCYLGQEVVARLHFLGTPSKLLRRLELVGDTLPRAGDEVVGDDPSKAAGVVRSVGFASTGEPVIFATVKKRYYEIGTPIWVRSGDALLEVRVAERAPSATGGSR